MDNSANKYKILTIILLISNIVFIWLYFSKNTEQNKTEETLVSTETAKKQLDSLLKINTDELKDYMGKNAELDSLIMTRNEEIQQQAKKIEELIKRGQISSAELARAQDELDVLRYYVQKYSRQVDSFARANDILVALNDSLKEDLTTTQKRYDEVSQKAAVLQVKVEAAAKLKAEAFTITGLQRRSGGSFRETSRAKRVNAMRVQFKLGENNVAEKNEKDFYLRIIGPDGQTLTDKASGGVFSFQGEEYKYTQRQPTFFDNNKQTIIFTYAQDLPWQEGNYRAEVYCEGFMIGATEFKLD